MVRVGGTVSLIAPHLLKSERTPAGRGYLVVDAPPDAPVVIHASYAAVQIRDLKGLVRVSAGRPGHDTRHHRTRGRGCTRSRLRWFDRPRTLSAEAEINMKLFSARLMERS